MPPSGSDQCSSRPARPRTCVARSARRPAAAPRVEVVRVAGELADRLAGVDEVALPVAGGAVDDVALVAGRAEVQRAVGDHVVHGLRDGPVLERRFLEVDDVVDDDVAVRVEAQRADVVREARVAVERGREAQLRRSARGRG